MGLTEFKVDLHVHTCLSPCAELDMLPGLIVKEAVKAGLDGIVICDHNSAENVSALKKAGAEKGLVVFGGIEICTVEEVHVLGLFEEDDSLFKMQETVYKNLFGENDDKYFGEQLVVDENGRLQGVNGRLLIGSVSLSVDEVVDLIHGFGGLVIASHVDRQAFSIIGQLGFIPKGLLVDAVEISCRCADSEISNYESYGFPIVRSSDAHFLSDIGKGFTRFYLEEFSFSEMVKAFGGIEGREMKV